MHISLSDDPDEQFRAENLLWLISVKDHEEVTTANTRLVDLLVKHGLVRRVHLGLYVSATRKGLIAAKIYAALYPVTALA